MKPESPILFLTKVENAFFLLVIMSQNKKPDKIVNAKELNRRDRPPIVEYAVHKAVAMGVETLNIIKANS